MRAATSLLRRVGGRGAAAAGGGTLLGRRWLCLPPHSLLPMPALSPTMTQGNLVTWKKKEGDSIEAGDVIAEVETDKATVDYEAVDDGILAKILVPEGTEDVLVGTSVAVVVDEAGDVGAFADYVPSSSTGNKAELAPAKPAPAPAPAAAAPPPPPAGVVAAAAPRAAGAPVPASPLAKRMAAQMGIPLAALKGTGPGGRVIAADVKEPSAEEATTAKGAAPGAAVVPAGAEYIDLPNSNIRKVTAKNMVKNKNENPHYYDHARASETQPSPPPPPPPSLPDLCHTLASAASQALEAKISVNDYVIKAAALALKEVPACNSSYTDEYIRERCQYSAADISVAVNTDRGLLTPIVFGAASSRWTLAGLAKENKLKPEQFLGGTFTISNLGSMGVKQFTAIINAPQACILAVGGADVKVVPDGKGGFTTKSVMVVSLSSDHRVVDGMIAAQYLKSFKKYMENPLLLLLSAP
ncbi:dihydrolipoamide acetyltransferase [Emiliania huxleyi CCMP1516]|uniref:Dihydrolipoamide acetyltransferase component of pyruvate dehydrogenase complex n=2 Tax=Emiliania huxleyi TaxID=2903 RepID=A0A0D3I7R8_EMIH1|nr:dihydrolipoamide acetyltransferase [Emiliania huxleyi CCMP1516]EOD07303.1 dihydrolipoamide acetyltransferase [Emiliania huxleyi CCMP1516]|eukprot:XP_005759732.1 dihydrolipoamide acetyltransferase [Emiliania huxleyi CCMP1516]